MAPERLPPELARRFRSGRPSLDFCHTGGEGPAARWEILRSRADLERWLGYLVGAEVRAEDPDLASARRLRSAIWSTANAVAAGDEPAATDVRRVNAAAAKSPLVPRLERGRATVESPAPAAAALSALARDAIDLLGGPLAGRVRVCAAEDCALLFVDTSRPGRRRWCSMERCGNLAKKRAHRARANR